jgi:hypothetical protein
MVLDVLEDDVNGLALVLGRPARGAALAQLGGQELSNSKCASEIGIAEAHGQGRDRER